MFAPTLQCQVTTCFDLCLIMPPIGEQRKATAGKRKAEDGLRMNDERDGRFVLLGDRVEVAHLVMTPPLAGGPGKVPTP